MLPEEDIQRWMPELTRVELWHGMVLNEAGAAFTHCYFPTTAIVSLHHLLRSGACAETALVGREGLVGISLFMGDGSTSNRAVVQTAGHAWRLPARTLVKEFSRASGAMRIALRYTQALLTQMAQTAVCNRHHSLEQQLCKWFLFRLDRLSGNNLFTTHELIASMLGVRREGVTDAALKLQRRGIIRYTRGHITVLDRQALEAGACECYCVVKKEYDRLLPTLAHAPAGFTALVARR
ncbi:MAG: Crp/Fnr family transcriptional regulator [Burkholderiaceae bacterium]